MCPRFTLRNLMNHTSGLRDWGSVAEISGWGRQKRTHTHAHVLDIASRQSALNFEPGREYSYCNTGYNLLAVVVSRTSGMSFAEFSKKRIFEPLGMSNTQWRDDYTRIVKGRSTAYSVRDGKVAIMRPIEDVHGNGGILTTVSDLLIWNLALTDGRLGGPQFLKMMHERGRLNDGREIAYASGLFVSSFAGVPSITHTGGTSGYRAYLGRFPDQELSVAMLCNASNVRTRETGGKIARVYLSDAAQEPVAPRGEVIPLEELAKKVGLYRDVQTGVPLRLVLQDDRLHRDGDDQTALIALSPTEFQADSGWPRFVFQPAAEGGRPSFRLHSEVDTDAYFEPVEGFEPSPAELRAYEGDYYSEDAETRLILSVEDGELQLGRRPNWTVKLSPEYHGTFDAPELGFIRFHRDAEGRIVELSLRRSRVYDMRFQRAAKPES